MGLRPGGFFAAAVIATQLGGISVLDATFLLAGNGNPGNIYHSRNVIGSSVSQNQTR
jgi:hypothetical protein